MSNPVLDELLEIVSELRSRRVDFALVGGLAVAVRGEPRFTDDVDVAIAVRSDEEVEALVHDLRARGYEVRALVEHKTQRCIATVRLRSPRGVTVDLISGSSGIEREIVRDASAVHFDQTVSIPVAQAVDLLAMKVLSSTSHRAQDLLDVRSLLAVNPTLDMDAVRKRLETITARGFNREQDLLKKLERLVVEASRDDGTE